jgi:hypothetical protein
MTYHRVCCCPKCDCDLIVTPPVQAVVTLAGLTPARDLEGAGPGYHVWVGGGRGPVPTDNPDRLNTTFSPLTPDNTTCLMYIHFVETPGWPTSFMYPPDPGPTVHCDGSANGGWGIDFPVGITATLIRLKNRRWELWVSGHPDDRPGVTPFPGFVYFHGVSDEMDCGAGTIVFNNDPAAVPGGAVTPIENGQQNFTTAGGWGSTGGTATVVIT